MVMRKIRLTEDIDICCPPSGNVFQRAEISISKGTEGFIEEDADHKAFGCTRPLVSIPIAKGVKVFLRTNQIKRLRRKK
jgi:hypothetical protein